MSAIEITLDGGLPEDGRRAVVLPSGREIVATPCEPEASFLHRARTLAATEGARALVFGGLPLAVADIENMSDDELRALANMQGAMNNAPMKPQMIGARGTAPRNAMPRCGVPMKEQQS